MSVEVTQADIDCADAIAALYGWSRASDAARERVARHRIEAKRGALERAAGALEADAPLCDCNAHGSHECCCGAWDDRKTVTLERAAEIVRSLIGEGE